MRKILLAWLGMSACGLAAAPGYVVLTRNATRADAEWAKVVDALVAKYPGARVVGYDKEIGEAQAALRELHPDYLAIVAKPGDAGSALVLGAHKLARDIDDDPYEDCCWGIVTGRDAANALQMAKVAGPFSITRAGAATEIALDCVKEALVFSELDAGKIVRKKAGGAPVVEKGADDSTSAVAGMFNDYKPQLLVTSGHASERNWMLGYRYKNGTFASSDGALAGVDTKGAKWPVHADGPLVYLAVGNCLMGHIDGKDAMALAWMNSAGVRQMVGYIEPTWYGYMGWGMLDYFLEQPGRFTTAQAFQANHRALVHRLLTVKDLSADDRRGLEFDRDHVVFYGDPAWDARMAAGPLGWEQKLTVSDAGGAREFVFTVTPLAGAKSYAKVNGNGSQRGGRPIIQFLPLRLKADTVKITAGADSGAMVADDFLLVPHPPEDSTQALTVKFRAEPADKSGKP